MIEKLKFSAERLREARKAARHSQESLAEAVGLSRGAIAQYESEEIVPRSEPLAMIARELGKPQEFFFCAVDQNHSQSPTTPAA